jgi:hypothetical protein
MSGSVSKEFGSIAGTDKQPRAVAGKVTVGIALALTTSGKGFTARLSGTNTVLDLELNSGAVSESVSSMISSSIADVADGGRLAITADTLTSDGKISMTKTDNSAAAAFADGDEVSFILLVVD